MCGGAFAGLLCEPFGLIVTIKFLAEIFSDYKIKQLISFWDFGIDMKFFKARIDNGVPILSFASETIFILSSVT
jgi:hypothetical protein